MVTVLLRLEATSVLASVRTWSPIHGHKERAASLEKLLIVAFITNGIASDSWVWPILAQPAEAMPFGAPKVPTIVLRLAKDPLPATGCLAVVDALVALYEPFVEPRKCLPGEAVLQYWHILALRNQVAPATYRRAHKSRQVVLFHTALEIPLQALPAEAVVARKRDGSFDHVLLQTDVALIGGLRLWDLLPGKIYSYETAFEVICSNNVVEVFEGEADVFTTLGRSSLEASIVEQQSLLRCVSVPMLPQTTHMRPGTAH
jgi:hypothetical protein